jgi:RNA polymerase sigma-70 factor (ECF subfamily)
LGTIASAPFDGVSRRKGSRFQLAPELPFGVGTAVNQNERDLLAKARLGDAEAFHALLLPRQASLRRLAFAFTGNWDEADDLAQEAMVKAFRALGSFEERSAFSTWLYSIARSVCRDWHRRLSGDRFQLAELDDRVGEGLLQDELLEKRELSEVLWSAIQRLDPEFRTTLVLSDVEGLSYQEIAEVEDVPVGTVRSRLSRARARLRKMLSQAHPSLLPQSRHTSDSSSPGAPT